MIESISSFFQFILSVLLSLGLVFFAWFMAMRSIDENIRMRLIFSSIGTALTFMVIGVLWITDEEEPYLKTQISSSTDTSHWGARAHEKKSPERKTLYLENYHHKGDSPVAIECYQAGSEVECRNSR